MRCLDHNSMCSLICQVKDCPKKLLCNQCMVKHNPTHYSMIQSISDLDYQISQVPQLIEKDLDKLKMKLYQIQNHIVLEKEQLKKQFLKMLDVLKSRLSAEIDDFCSNTLDYTNSYYKSFETDVGTLLSVIANHVNIVAPYATRVRPLNESQFQMLIDFQEKMLTNIMPTLTKKAEVLSKQVFENPLHMKTDNFYAIVKTYLNKGLQAYNLFHNNQNQIEQKKALEMKLDEPYLSKSHLLPLNDDYKQSAREVLRDHYSLERKSAREQLQKSQFNLPKIKSVTELYSAQRNIYNYQKQLNTILTGHTDIITCICILTPTQLLSGGGGGAIRIWDLDSAISLGQFNEHAGDVWALAKINDVKNKQIQIHFASASADQTVRIWNYSKMICESILVGHVEPIMALIYLRDVDYLASGSTDTSIKIWQAGRAKLKMTIQDSQKIKCLCYIEIKGLLLSGGNGAIKVFNILNGYCRDQLEGHQGEVYALRHLQDTLLGEQVSIVASGGADQKIMIWNVDKGLKLQIFTGHQDTINGLAYDIENNQLWSVSSDRSIKVWDLIRGKLLVSMKKHSEQISCIEFMKQRELVITGSWDHKIRVCSRSLYFT